MLIPKKQRTADLKVFLGIVATLIIIGLIFIYSSSSVYALSTFESSHFFVKRQFIGLIIGSIGLLIARFFPLSLLKKLSPLIFLITLGITALTLVPLCAHHVHGSSRWLNLFGLTFQPSELLKNSFIIYLAFFLTKKEKISSSFFHGYLPFLIILALSCIILLKQPDFGLTITLCITACTLLFIAQFNNKHLLITIGALIPVSLTLIFLKPYRLKRIATFLNPWADPQGSGFQIIQSLIAIGSGKYCGVGIANSKQKFFYLPMQHTDFIFSIIAEETGFIGCATLILLYLLFLYFGMRIAWRMHDNFSTFVTLGFVILISLQAIINIAVATCLLPTKGIGLPFISYGNTALVCNLCMIGLIMNMFHSTES